MTGLLAASVLAACSSASPYASTAAKLTRTERVAPGVEFVKEWQPERGPLPQSPSADDELSAESWLTSCINELAGRFTPAPADTVRALQIAECMAVRGWHLAVRESSPAGLAASSVP